MVASCAHATDQMPAQAHAMIASVARAARPGSTLNAHPRIGRQQADQSSTEQNGSMIFIVDLF